MKIGILTFYKVLNYGAVLQAYALSKVLKDRGHETFLINYQPNQLTSPYRKVTLKWFYNILYLKVLYRRYNLFSPFKIFFNRYLNEGQKYDFLSQLIENPPKADLYIAGSDQIWNSHLTGNEEIAFFLPFSSTKTSIISYAASCGGDYSFLDKLEIISLLKRFNRVSVREKSLQVKLMEKGIVSKVVLDPTLLLEKYDEFLTANLFGNYIVVYNISISEDFSNKLLYLKKISGLKVINIGPHFLKEADSNIIGISPDRWVNFIYHANFVFTDSFHGVAFSVNFKKKFLFIPKGAISDLRITDFLTTIGLLNCVIYNTKNLDDIIIQDNVFVANENLKVLRDFSLQFLEDNIL